MLEMQSVVFLYKARNAPCRWTSPWMYEKNITTTEYDKFLWNKV